MAKTGGKCSFICHKNQNAIANGMKNMTFIYILQREANLQSEENWFSQWIWLNKHLLANYYV